MADSTSGPPGIYTMNIDGTELKPVAITGDTVDFPGNWGEKYILGKTTGVSVLGNPKWSPNGKMIACDLMWAFEGYVLLIMNADGSNKHVLWKVRAAAQKPQWSPDGDKLLFTRRGFGAVIGLGIVDSSGENDRDFKIWGNNDPYTFQGDSIWFVGDYQWGTTRDVIFASASMYNRPEIIYLPGSNINNEIFTLNSTTGKALQRITYNNIDEYGFKLSPIGNMAAFQTKGKDLTSEFHVIKFSEGTILGVKPGAEVDFAWNWSSDGCSIIYAKDENPDVYLTDYHLYNFDICETSKEKRITIFKSKEPDLSMN